MLQTPARESAIGHEAAASRAFACTVRYGDGVAWIGVAGQLDIATTPEFGRILRMAELRARLIVLDLRALTFIDSTGVHLIGYASVRAKRVRRRLIVVRGPAQVDRMFALPAAPDGVEIADLDPAEPPVQVLLKLARAEAAARTLHVWEDQAH